MLAACPRLRVAVLATLSLVPLLAAPAFGQVWTHPMLAHGQQPNHGYFSAAPWEKVDMASGNVILTFPGLTLPGANGMDFQFTAVANTGGANGSVAWSYGVPGPATIAFGYGESMNPVIGMTDGGRQVAYLAGTHRYRTQSWELLEIDMWLDDATLKRPDGVVYTFHRYNYVSCQGTGGWYPCGAYLITSTTDPYGNGLDYVRTAEGALTGFVQRVGGQTRTITLTHETDALVVSWDGAGGPARTWRYVFAPNTMCLVDIVPPTGPGWHFDYSTPHAVTVTTPNGGRVTYQLQLQYGPNQEYAPHQPIYHTWRLQTRTVAGMEHGWAFTFEDMNSPAIDSSVTLPTGDVRSYQHTRIEGGVYAARQVLATVAVNPGASFAEVITYTWRPSPHPVGEAVGVWPDLNEPATWYQEDGAPMLIGAVTTTRDGAAFTTTYAYCGESGQPGCSTVGDPLYTSNVLDYGNPTFVRETSTVTAADWVTRYTYRDDFGARYVRGRVASQTLESGGASYSRSAQYDDTGFRVSETVLDVTTAFARDDYGHVGSVTDANGHTTSFSSAWGVVANTQTEEFLVTRAINPDGTVSSVSQNGATTTFEYDGLGRQTRVQPPEGHDTRTAYADEGTWVQVSRGLSWTRTTLDEFGRDVRRETSVGVLTDTTYDDLGRTHSTTAPYAWSLHPVIHWTTFDYDALDRVFRKTNPDSSTATYVYTAVSNGAFTGLQTSITENGHTTRQLWHAVGAPGQAWLRAVEDADGQRTWYEYNALGSLTKVIQPGVIRTWHYNERNRLDWQTQPESGTVTYGYDNVGNLITQTDAKNQTTGYTYDGNNRLTHVTSADSTYSTTITYDAANNRTSVSNGYVSSSFTYDGANRLRTRIDEMRTVPGVPGRRFVAAFTPDGNGNVVDVRYPSGNHVQYGYDSENRVTEVYDLGRGLTFASGITYHPSGGLAGYASGDGATHSLGYDARERPAEITATGVANLPDLTYNYDTAGNVQGIADSRAGHSATFTYDALDRLKTANGGGWGTLTYSYDAVGNRLEQIHTTPSNTTTTTAYTYGDTTRMQITGQSALQYDANGNQTQDSIGTYAYTPTNMLETASLVAGAVYTYRYDGDQQRMLKHAGSVKATYYLRGLGQVLSEFEEQGGQAHWTIDHVYLGSRLLAGVRPASGTVALAVQKAGAGSGTVTSTPAGLVCGAVCSQTFAIGTVVTLTATPDPGWVFAGWAGDPDCADGVVTLTAALTCQATFTLHVPLFAKQAPAPASTWASRSLTLAWTPVPNATYLVCWDTTNNNTCDTGWQPTYGATTRVLENLGAGTYYWQVKTVGQPDGTPADDGTWWSFTIAVPDIPADHWVAEYYPNPTLTAPAARTVDDGTGFLHHDWHGGSPTGLPPDHFSARYTRTLTLPAGRYRFFVLADDGSRLWVDGQLKIDAWGDMAGPTIFTTVVDLTAGDHTVRYEWYHGVGPATARLSWAEVSTSILGPAEALHPGNWATSADGQYWIWYQGDGNLAVRRFTWEVAWESGTAGTGTPMIVAMQYDGNLVMYTEGWQPVWSTGTAGHPGAWLQLANDELVIRDPEGEALWTRSLEPPLLTKQAPAPGATVTGGAVTLTWTAVAGESYLVCWDTTANTTCEGTWTSAGTATTLTVNGVAPGTYYWQVKTAGGGVPADNGTWRSFTVVAAPPFAKQAPATGTTGLGSPVTLQWTAVSSEGYRVCWDTTNNSTCDTGWQENGGATTRALTALPVGTYYWQVKTTGSGVEADGGTWWSFTVTVPPVPADHWKAEYFGNRDLTGAAVATVDEGTGFVDHSWGTGGPAGLSDDFSARFTRTVTLAAGTYRFTVVTDDGSRLWIDDQPKIAAWWDQSATHTVDVDLSAGGHTLRYEYYEHTGGALARLTWALILEVPAGTWTAEYFANMSLSGTPASTVEEVSVFIDHPWGDGGPEGVPADGFSARFTRTLAFPAGTYRFTVVTDDGSRLWMDDQLVIDAWWDQAPSTYTADVTLSGGDHTVRYEF